MTDDDLIRRGDVLNWIADYRVIYAEDSLSALADRVRAIPVDRVAAAALSVTTEILKDVAHPTNPTSCYISAETQFAIDYYRAAVEASK